MWTVRSAMQAYGATVHWRYGGDQLWEGQATKNSGWDYTIQLSDGAAGGSNVNWPSPRYPAEGEFENSQGESTHFDAGNLSFTFVREGWEGIDNAEQTARHEMGHVKVWRRWEPGGAWHTLYGAWPSEAWPDHDHDLDHLPNAVEDNLGTDWDFCGTFHPLNPNYPGDPEFYLTGTDEEIFCEKESKTPSWPSIHSNEDHARPGKRWHELYPND